jgi:hypothetical protein
MNYLILRFCQTADANYYPLEEGLNQGCAHIERDNENPKCAFQFPCFETGKVFKDSGRMGCKFACRDNIT